MPLFPLSTLHGQSSGGAIVVSLRCPFCGNQGSFHGRSDVNDLVWNQALDPGEKAFAEHRAGVRICPNRDCGAPVFVITRGKQVLRSYPPEVLDFDATSLPTKIASTLEEAIKCHAGECFRASALMVRRALEEVCDDKNAQGKDLKQRLASLGNAVLVPKELLEAADELRILGNDAAHIEAKEYDQIGKTEAEVAIDLAKELLKAVYQYSGLVDRLRSLKKQTTS